MGILHSSSKRLFFAVFIRFSKATNEPLYPIKFSFYSSSTKPRNLNDIAARYAREFGIGWHHLVIQDVSGKKISERYRRYYKCFIK